MNYKPIIIVAGEPNSIFFELFFKVIKKKIKSPIILIASKKLITKQAKILKNKLEVEALWNELILIKFSAKVKVDEKNLRKQINNNSKFLKSYLLSEISFEVSNLKNLDDKFIEISDVINNQGFDFAALKYSVSPTSSLGGKLDWINENSLNNTIREAINHLEINDFTKPINFPGGFLILQINDIRNTQIEVNVEEELIKITNFEKNNQLNQYSKIYFNKIKKNLQIDEL